jgi:hypothetical protein
MGVWGKFLPETASAYFRVRTTSPSSSHSMRLEVQSME